MCSNNTPLNPVMLVTSSWGDVFKADINFVFLSHYQDMGFPAVLISKRKIAVNRPPRVSIRLLCYAENQGWTETVTGILRSLKATVAHVVTQECSSTETGVSWPVMCRQTWWTIWAAWPKRKKRKLLQDEEKYNVGLTFSRLVRECQSVHLPRP